MFDKRKILITGISGFVGSALTNELQKEGKFEIFGLAGKSRMLAGSNPELQKRIFQTDITDEKTLHLADELGKTDILVHTAGLAHQFGRVEKRDFWKVNVKGTENVCRLAVETGVKHFILISSVAVYGTSGDAEIDETFECHPRGFYAESKFESENLVNEWCQNNNLRLTILRLATVIGEGDRGNTARLITKIDRGRFLWVGDGRNKKSLIYKGDAARGISKVVESEGMTGACIFNLTGETVSIREIVEAIYRNLKKKAPRIKISEKAVRGIFRLNKTGISPGIVREFETTIEKWLSSDVFSGEKFNEKFGFNPKTPVSEAIARQVEFYLEQKTRVRNQKNNRV